MRIRNLAKKRAHEGRVLGVSGIYYILILTLYSKKENIANCCCQQSIKLQNSYFND